MTSFDQSMVIFEAVDQTGGTTPIQVTLSWVTDHFELFVSAWDDTAGAYVNTDPVTITADTHSVEFDWQAGSAPGSGDGSLDWWVDGAAQTSLSGLDNGAQAIDEAHLGLISQGGDANPPVFDAFESHRQSYIGPAGSRSGHVQLLVQPPAPAAAPRPAANPLHERPLPRPIDSAVSTPPTGQTWTLYYYAGAQRIAERVLVGSSSNTLYYISGDQLGSTSLVTCGSTTCGSVSLGGVVDKETYYAFGGVRSGGSAMPTDYRFTGQRQQAGIGLYDYAARFYDPYIGRFESADTVIASYGNPQTLNRYAYVTGNPIKNTDPTGHIEDPDDEGGGGGAEAGIGDGFITGGVNGTGTQRGGNQGGISLQPPTSSNGQLTTTNASNSSTPSTSGYVQLSLPGLEVEPAQPTVSTTPPKPTASNAVGTWSVERVGDNLPIETNQFSVGNGARVYDGRFIGTSDSYVEIKGSNSPTLNLNDHIRGQISYDAGTNPKPLWVFVDTTPSGSFQTLLQMARIPWHVLHP